METVLLKMMELYNKDVLRYPRMKDLCNNLIKISENTSNYTSDELNVDVLRMLFQFQIIAMDHTDSSNIHIIDYITTERKNDATESNNIKYIITPTMTLGHLGIEDNVFVFSSTENEFVDYIQKTCKNIENNKLLIAI